MFALILGLSTAAAWPTPSGVKGVPPDLRETFRRASMPDPVTLRWRAPEDCPSEEALRSAVEARLDAPLSRGMGFQLAIEIGVRRQAGGNFYADIWTTDDVGAHLRELDDSDCSALAVAVAFVVAMAIDVRVREQAEREREAVAVTERPEPRAVTRPPPAASDTVSLRRRKVPLRGALRVAVGLMYGDIPGIVPGFRGTVALLAPRWRVEGELGYAFGTTRRGDETRRLEMLTGLVRACPAFRLRRLEFPLCAGVEAGTLMARGSPEGTQRGAFVSVHASTGVFLALHRYVSASIVFVEGNVHVTRPRFAYTDNTVEPAVMRTYTDMGLLGVRVLTGIEVRFPR